PSEQLIQAAREHQPDVIGLSGLLVKSAQQMVLTAGDLAAVGISTPPVAGGAALTRRFTHRKIAPAYGSLCTYARDAMHGLRLVEQLTDPAKREELQREVATLLLEDQEGALETPSPVAPDPAARRVPLRADVAAPPPPDFERHAETRGRDSARPCVTA